MDWSQQKVLVTSGASYIGSHRVEALHLRGAKVRIVDDLSSGHLDNIRGHLDAGRVEFTHAYLREPSVTRSAVEDISVVFYLAADLAGSAMSICTRPARPPIYSWTASCSGKPAGPV
jgi:nucleoside-diphosphate-sugar epimerase